MNWKALFGFGKVAIPTAVVGGSAYLAYTNREVIKKEYDSFKTKAINWVKSLNPFQAAKQKMEENKEKREEKKAAKAEARKEKKEERVTKREENKSKRIEKRAERKEVRKEKAAVRKENINKLLTPKPKPDSARQPLLRRKRR